MSEYGNNFSNNDNSNDSGIHYANAAEANDEIEGGDKWLARGRSLNTAAIGGLILIGVFYMLMQVVFLVVGILASGLGQKILMSGNDVVSLLSGSMELFVSPIRWALLLSEYLALLLPTILLIRR